MTTTTLTSATITRTLKKAGFRKSEGSTGRVRGFSDYSEGFTIERDGRMEMYRDYKGKEAYKFVPNGKILVSYTAQTGHTTQNDVSKKAKLVAKALKDAGFNVSTNFRGQLVVSQ